MYQMKKKPIWQRILGKLGVNKYKYNYFYSWDFANGPDCSTEIEAHYDDNGVLNITSFKMIEPPHYKEPTNE